VCLAALAACTPAQNSAPVEAPRSVGRPSDAAALCAIARDIETRKPDFPQLREFSAREHCDRDELVIRYAFHTHRGSGGGWSGAVPNPDPDGVWFYIDFHDPASPRQIHTQPARQRRTLRRWAVMLLVLDGTDVPPLAPALDAILREHGVVNDGL